MLWNVIVDVVVVSSVLASRRDNGIWSKIECHEIDRT